MNTKTPSYKTIDEYIATFPTEIQKTLIEIRKFLMSEAPGAVEAIKYGMPTLVLNGRNLIHFAAFTHHIGIYPTPSGVEAFKKDLTPYVTSKGAIQFPFDKPFPFELLKKIANFRINENSKELLKL